MQLEQQESFEIKGPQLEILGRAETGMPPAARKKPVAALALAALALVSVFGIGGLRLKGVYQKTQAIYATQTDGYGHGIQSDFGAQVDAAASLIRVAGSVLGEDDDTVRQAQTQLDAWNSISRTPSQQYQVNRALYTAVDTLYNTACDQADASKRDQLEELYAEFTSRQAILERETANDYNPAAQEYNRITDSFPGSLIGRLWGVEQAELYAIPTDARQALATERAVPGE